MAQTVEFTLFLVIKDKEIVSMTSMPSAALAMEKTLDIGILTGKELLTTVRRAQPVVPALQLTTLSWMPTLADRSKSAVLRVQVT